jgi:hypothetical protein
LACGGPTVFADTRSLPEVVGVAALRVAAHDPAGLEKLVVISGDTASAEIQTFVTRLRQPIIQKPFDMRTLADLLDRTAPPRAASAAS